MKKIRIKKQGWLILLIIFIVIMMTINLNKEVVMIDLSSYTISEVKEYAEKNHLKLIIKEEYSDLKKDTIINQSIKPGDIIKKGDLKIIISNGLSYTDIYKEYQVNELGFIPVMMYHGTQHVKSSETAYTGGNVDREGYQRTTEAFIKDLEFYYQEGYRMIRLEDYVKGIIDVELGKSPIVLTFDDGLQNNINVLGLDDEGEIMIDPNSTVGILESYKKKYPDFKITATFFINGGLFQQPKYNNQILKWLIKNGYDIGNHSYGHANFKNTSTEQTKKEIARLYQQLDDIIPNQYVHIVALPFGSPFVDTHPNYKYILEGTYQDYHYKTISTLKVGYKSDYSPYDKRFNSKFINRIRAYDNNGLEFDIEMNFKLLKDTKYISDGSKDKIVIPESEITNINPHYQEVISY
ncbi:MAG: polysaccharide deacetylase family protein [Bacilli bacterium]|nr:polysaccharide deacetylase family protein [Bacilli bacterium]MDD4808591.1 polysaccharide deacetylase family protein [Bacilli bacterium]